MFCLIVYTVHIISSGLSKLDNNDEGNSIINEDNNDEGNSIINEDNNDAKAASRCIQKKVFLKKHLFWSIFFNKVADLQFY